jgi:hypothetical protein
MLPATALKVALDVPAPIVTDAGTLRAAALLESVTVAAAEADWFSETVQVEAAPLFKAVGLHDRPFTTVGA